MRYKLTKRNIRLRYAAEKLSDPEANLNIEKMAHRLGTSKTSFQNWHSMASQAMPDDSNYCLSPECRKTTAQVITDWLNDGTIKRVMGG